MARIRLQDVSKIYEETFNVARLFLWRPPLPGDSLKPDGDQATPPESAVRALNSLNLTVEDGETMVVVGPSGCGKSTLLRVVAGLTDYEGLITYDGQDVSAIPVGERRIGMVFQGYALYPHFYGQGNLRFFFQVHQAPDSETEERIRITADMMGYGFRELLKRKPGTLSGGQQQRLAIARALVRQPRLFLFDEPLSNLDAKLRTRTRVEIKRLLHRFGITAIYVTHDQIEAMALADRVAVMRQGHIEQIGTFREVLQNPVNTFVAGFLGSPPMNLIEGTVFDNAIIAGENLRFPMPSQVQQTVNQGQKVTVGIRPGDAHLVTAGSTGSDLTASERIMLRATVDLVEPDFGRREQTVYVSTAGFSCIATSPLDTGVLEGSLVDVVLSQSALLYFDSATGNRIW